MAGCAAMCARAIGREHLAAFLFWRDFAERSIRGEQIRAILGDKVQALEMGSMSGVLRRWSRQYWHERVMLSMTRRHETNPNPNPNPDPDPDPNPNPNPNPKPNPKSYPQP